MHIEYDTISLAFNIAFEESKQYNRSMIFWIQVKGRHCNFLGVPVEQFIHDSISIMFLQESFKNSSEVQCSHFDIVQGDMLPWVESLHLLNGEVAISFY